MITVSVSIGANVFFGFPDLQSYEKNPPVILADWLRWHDDDRGYHVLFFALCPIWHATMV
jgi:hypothetical protein